VKDFPGCIRMLNKKKIGVNDMKQMPSEIFGLLKLTSPHSLQPASTFAC